MSSERLVPAKHVPCPGCGELADECTCPDPDPLAPFVIDTGYGTAPKGSAVA